MGRSMWKFKYFSPSIWRKIFSLSRKKRFKNKSKFFDRNSSIPKCFIKFTFNIYKGNLCRRFNINKYAIGMKFGEFAFTRKPFHFPFRKKKSKLIRR